jgi:hypothetical protein
MTGRNSGCFTGLHVLHVHGAAQQYPWLEGAGQVVSQKNDITAQAAFVGRLRPLLVTYRRVTIRKRLRSNI